MNDSKPSDDTVKPTGDAQSEPLMMRDSDTSRLKKIAPKTQNINLEGDMVTDTVHLKVIKEKKKQLTGILTASQTIRLRPPSAGDTQAAPVSNPVPSSAGTLKVSLPPGAGTGAESASSAGTLKINMPPAAPSPAGTLKINMPTASADAGAGTLKINMPTASADAGAGTLKIKANAPADAGAGTLKIKTTAEPAAGTLKIKSTSEQTVKVGGDAAGGTLKLKPQSTQAGEAVQAAQPTQSQRQQRAELPAVDPKTRPNFFDVFAGICAVGCVGFVVFKLLESYDMLWKLMPN